MGNSSSKSSKKGAAAETKAWSIFDEEVENIEGAKVGAIK